MNKELYELYFLGFIKGAITEHRERGEIGYYINFSEIYRGPYSMIKGYQDECKQWNKRKFVPEFIQAQKDFLAINESPLYNAMREHHLSSEEKK
jgi:hypothetical protein